MIKIIDAETGGNSGIRGNYFINILPYVSAFLPQFLHFSAISLI